MTDSTGTVNQLSVKQMDLARRIPQRALSELQKMLHVIARRLGAKQYGASLTDEVDDKVVVNFGETKSPAYGHTKSAEAWVEGYESGFKDGKAAGAVQQKTEQNKKEYKRRQLTPDITLFCTGNYWKVYVNGTEMEGVLAPSLSKAAEAVLSLYPNGCTITVVKKEV